MGIVIPVPDYKIVLMALEKSSDHSGCPGSWFPLPSDISLRAPGGPEMDRGEGGLSPVH